MHPLPALLLALTATATPSPLAKLEQRYLDGLFRARPHLATYLGDHRFDAQLMDLSDAATQKRIKEIEAVQAELKKIDVSKLSADEKADAQILADGSGLELFHLKDLQEFSWNPRFNDSFTHYDPREVIASRLEEIIHGDFGTPAQRQGWVLGQLKALPKLLAQEQKLLVHPSAVHLEQGIKDNAGRIHFFETDLQSFTRSNAATEKARLAAVTALQSHQKFLEAFPKAEATHDWKLGKALYEKKFPLALQTEVTPSELVDRATRAFTQTHAELYAVALKLHAKLFPKEQQPPAKADDATQAKVIRRVQTELTKSHPKADDLLKAHADRLATLRDFITQKDIIGLPPVDTLSVEAMPEYKRGGTGAEYLNAGTLDKKTPFKGVFHVDPVDPKWPPDQIESYLRANNNYEIMLTATHEAYPGHHTQAWYAHSDPSALRASFWSGAFAEGWAVWVTTFMVSQGLGGADNDGFRFVDLYGTMIVEANAILDVKLQTGQMTDEQALQFMEVQGFQEKALAEHKLLRAKLDSTQLCQYYLGLSELGELEKAWRAKGPFVPRKFNEAVVGHGTIPVKVLKTLLQ